MRERNPRQKELRPHIGDGCYAVLYPRSELRDREPVKGLYHGRTRTLRPPHQAAPAPRLRANPLVRRLSLGAISNIVTVFTFASGKFPLSRISPPSNLFRLTQKLNIILY